LGAQRRAAAIVLGRQVLQAVKGRAVAAADRHLPGAARIPGEAETRSQVQLVGRIKPVYDADDTVGETLLISGAAAECEGAQRAVFIFEGSIFLIAQADVEREIPLDLPVVLDEQGPLGLSQLREQTRRIAG